MLILSEQKDIKGQVEIVKITNNKIKKRKIYNNLITTAGKYFINQAIGGLTTDYLYYVGIGSGTTDVNITDTSIENEILLKQYTEVEIVGNQIIYTFFIEKAEGIGNWGNIGLLTNNKTLVSHLNISETKTSSDYILIYYKLGG